MEYNILDRVLDEDEYGPYSAEMRLRGLSKAGQDAYARKLFRDVSKKATRNGYVTHVDITNPETGEVILDNKTGKPIPGFDNDAFDNGMDLYRRYRRMPEEAQDAILLTLKEMPIVFQKPNTLSQRSSVERSGNAHYSLENGKSYLDSQNPYSFFHELGHNTAHRLNPKFDNSKVWTGVAPLEGDPRVVNWVDPKNDFVPDYAVVNNLGKEITELSGKWIKHGDGSSYLRYELNRNLREDMDERMKSLPHSVLETIGSSALDWGGLQPEYRGEGLSHSKKYKEYWQDNARRKWNVDESNADFAPLSMEGFAELYEIVSEPGGVEWLKENMPNTYNRFIEILNSDHRRNRFRAPKAFREIE